ncbi:helix-turn-helix domain-containing protein [Actinomyces oricola]|uniref:helix-turn-helix domain-containing protein n=1 Tax=Actinomyces oricola TaxID=206043 RepID=UPI000FFEE40B|nr:helix-turn-helix transcriptional regulator [Actinomyces oricola]
MGRFRVEEAPVLVRAARVDTGLTQAELAGRVGIAQPSLAQIERGARAVSPEMLERILKAADYRTSLALAAHAAAIRGSPWLGVKGWKQRGGVRRLLVG